MQQEHDILIRHGVIYDGSGATPYRADVAIKGQTISKIGKIDPASARKIIDAGGLAVCPGFINVLSWANASLIEDGRSQSDIRQGVTLEIVGEGSSEGPLSESMKKARKERQGDIKYDISWTTLGEYLDFLAGRGISTNIASYVGAATLRIHAVGYDDRPATPSELDQMRALAAQAMEEGAMGMSSALIYPPGSYAPPEELIELAKVIAKYNGIYISHLRNEGVSLLPALDELIDVARKANIRSEVYHLKVTGRQNWPTMEDAIQKIDTARAEGLQIAADMYTYPASSTGLGATMPDWIQEGGHQAWISRLKDPDIRKKLYQEMITPSNEWESSYLGAGGGENIILVGFKQEHLKKLQGKTLAQVAAERGTDPVYTIMDLIVEDDNNVSAVYFTMSEDNVRKQLKMPWVCIGSDGGSMAPEGNFIKSGTHPRSYGTFARFLGRYVRDEKLVPLEEGIRRMTSLPARFRQIDRRGELKPGFFADVVVFDPAAVRDLATFEKPHQYSIGVRHVFVNGTQVLNNGEHTNARPGQVVRGPGYHKK
jgi:N-acyl-D-amino-acid deacylase